MTEPRVINCTDTIQDARMLLTCLVSALEGGADIIDVTGELTCTPTYLANTVLSMLTSMATEQKLSDDEQELLAAIKAQFAIADAAAL